MLVKCVSPEIPLKSDCRTRTNVYTISESYFRGSDSLIQRNEAEVRLVPDKEPRQLHLIMISNLI